MTSAMLRSFRLRDLFWLVTVIAILLGWAVDRGLNRRGNALLRDWQFQHVAHYLKEETQVNAFVNPRGEVVFEHPEGSVITVLPPKSLGAPSIPRVK
jgi:hypothetical protein